MRTGPGARTMRRSWPPLRDPGGRFRMGGGMNRMTARGHDVQLDLRFFLLCARRSDNGTAERDRLVSVHPFVVVADAHPDGAPRELVCLLPQGRGARLPVGIEPLEFGQ